MILEDEHDTVHYVFESTPSDDIENPVLTCAYYIALLCIAFFLLSSDVYDESYM